MDHHAGISLGKAEVLSDRNLAQLLVTLSLDLGHLPREPEQRQALAALLAPRALGLEGTLLVDTLDLMAR